MIAFYIGGPQTFTNHCISHFCTKIDVRVPLSLSEQDCIDDDVEVSPLLFEHLTYDRWMEVFDAWEQGKFIMEDRNKSDGCILKIPTRDITMNDVDRTVGLCDSKMMKLADAIFVKEVSIKSNKPFGGQQREGISL